jgi:hypothetical protein
VVPKAAPPTPALNPNGSVASRSPNYEEFHIAREDFFALETTQRGRDEILLLLVS